jgi:ethanolamine utilization microcompartment shell protein EutL
MQHKFFDWNKERCIALHRIARADSQMNKYALAQIGQAVALVLALASEIRSALQFRITTSRFICLEFGGSGNRSGERGV